MILDVNFRGAHFVESSQTWEFPLPPMAEVCSQIRSDYAFVKASQETGWVDGGLELLAFPGDPSPDPAARHIARCTGFSVRVRDRRRTYTAYMVHPSVPSV